MPYDLPLSQTRLLRLRAQCLHPKTASTSVSQAVKAVCGIQAQEKAASELAIRARGYELTIEDVRRVREEDRSIVLTWLMRGTMHLVSTDDISWMLPFFGSIFIHGSERRYNQLGLTLEIRHKARDLMVKALTEHGAMIRAELAAILSKAGIPTEGQAIVHLLGFAAMSGAICFGPFQGREPTYVLLDKWLPNLTQPMDTEQTLAELARRYLAAYAPATSADLASWAGISVIQARAGFEAITAELIQVNIAGAPAYMLKTQAQWLDAVDSDPVVRLLGAYDTYLLGYQSRDSMVAAAYARQVHPGGGFIYPTLMVDGMIAGTWRIKRAKRGSTIQVKPFEPLPEDAIAPLEAEAQDIGRFWSVESRLEIENP